jgi:hypothetical protein
MARFTSFVLFAEMRTGSNFLEDNLNRFPDIRSHGELFNPHFVGFANRMEMCGVSFAERERDPARMLARMRETTEGLPGFRFFHDHDPRVLPRVLEDLACAKVVLTRNPLDSYVSRKIAARTGQWKLTDLKHQKTAQIRFDAAEFEEMLEQVQEFQLLILNALQVTGQTAFYIGYEDINDVEVLNGLAKYLGSAHRIDAVAVTLKRQNPEPLSRKVLNYDEMRAALAGLDRFDLTRTPNFEPRRGAGVPGFHTGLNLPLLFMPVKAAPVAPVLEWMIRHEVALGAAPEGALASGHNQKTLRQWRRQHPGHRSFTVLRHPLARAHAAFSAYVLGTGHGEYAEIRETLRSQHGLALPPGAPGPGWDAGAHRAAFLGFLGFLRRNLAGQTSLRIDPAWASQAALLQGMAQVGAPDHVLREDGLAASLARLEAEVGVPSLPLGAAEADAPLALAAIHDAELEAAARAVYARDYLTFGFGDWTGV